MQLWEDRKVVNALKQVLTSYEKLEYDETVSKRIGGLNIKVTHFDADRDNSVALNICKTLGQITGKHFSMPSFNIHGHQDLNKKWTSVTLHEQHFHENVKITYPKDNTEPLVIECYVGEIMQVDFRSPHILRYANEKGEIKTEFRVVDRKTGRAVKIWNEVKNIGTDIIAKTTADILDKAMKP